MASRHTGVITLKLANWKDYNLPNVFSSPVRSAFLSWGFLVRNSICHHLEIDNTELDLGFRVKNEQGIEVPEIFIVEKMENGAGYCNYINGDFGYDISADAMINPLIKRGEIYNALMDENHICDNSCYDCLHDYYNQSYHSQLNWRLGLDLAYASSIKNFQFDFSREYWHPFLSDLADSIAKKLQGSKMSIKNTYGIEYGNKTLIISHPLWCQDQLEEINNITNGMSEMMDVHEVIRRSKFKDKQGL